MSNRIVIKTRISSGLDRFCKRVRNEYYLSGREKNMNAELDRELVKKIVAGDPKAEEKLFKRYEKKLIKKMIHFTQGNGDDWKDLLSDLHLTVLNNLRAGKYDPARGELNYYISGIAKNILRKYFKEKKIVNSRQAPLEDIYTVKEECDIEKQERKKHVEELLKTLEPKYRKVLMYKYFEELKPAAIGAEMNITPETVSSHLNYAIKKLKKRCENNKYFSIFSLILAIWV